MSQDLSRPAVPLQEAPKIRPFHQSVVLKDSMFVWDLWDIMFSVNLLTGKWCRHEVILDDSAIKMKHTCRGTAAVGDTFYFYGGRRKSFLDIWFLLSYQWSSRWAQGFENGEGKLYKLKVENMKWSVVQTRGRQPSGRCEVVMCSVNGKLLLMEEIFRDLKGNYYHSVFARDSELFEFDPQKECWSHVLVAGSKPRLRHGHTLTAVNTKKAILFAGYDGKELLNDLWLFDSEWKVVCDCFGSVYCGTM